MNISSVLIYQFQIKTSVFALGMIYGKIICMMKTGFCIGDDLWKNYMYDERSSVTGPEPEEGGFFARRSLPGTCNGHITLEKPV